jgi:hypothetical protein
MARPSRIRESGEVPPVGAPVAVGVAVPVWLGDAAGDDGTGGAAGDGVAVWDVAALGEPVLLPVSDADADGLAALVHV